jgi:hypothetical protein
MSNPMSGDQSPFDKAKEAASGLKDKLSGKRRQQEEGQPGEDVPPPDESAQDPMPPDQQFPPQ